MSEAPVDKIKKWRLILGQTADPEKQVDLGKALAGKDGVLESLYNEEAGDRKVDWVALPLKSIGG